MIEHFIKKEQLVKDPTVKNLAEPYLKKARSNLVTMELLSKAEKFKEVLALPEDHTDDEWVVVTAYYAMYMSALSLLAKLGYRSKNHTATALALEELLVKRNYLTKAILKTLRISEYEKKKLKCCEMSGIEEKLPSILSRRKQQENLQRKQNRTHAPLSIMQKKYLKSCNNVLGEDYFFRVYNSLYNAYSDFTSTEPLNITTI